MKRLSLALLILLPIATLVLMMSLAMPVLADPPSSPDAATELEDKPEKLEPKKKRSEAEQDKVDALALFAEARSLEQKE